MEAQLGLAASDHRLLGDYPELSTICASVHPNIPCGVSCRQGVFNTGVTYVLVSWAISRRGPIYPSMFSPLMLILTTVMDSMLLGTNIYLGR